MLLRAEPIDRGPEPEDDDEDDDTWGRWFQDDALTGDTYLVRMGSHRS